MRHLRKLASLMLALVMVLCCALPVFAVNTELTPNNNPHTITITNAQESHTYEAYQVFRGDISDGKLTNITWGTGVNGAALLAALKTDSVIGGDFAACESAEDVAKVVAGYSDNSDKLDAFAEVVGKHLSDTKFTNTTTYSKIEVTGDGYYLLKDKDGSVTAGGDAYTKYILKVVADVEVAAKMETITLDKKIVEGSDRVTATNASIGDVVTFELTSDVPGMDGYDSYIFTVHDTLSAGLTFNNDISVKIGTKTLSADYYDENEGTTAPGDYAVNVNGQKIEIVFHDFIENKGLPEDADTITITYTATLNEKANITGTGNKNVAYLEYSNDPNYTGDGDDGDGDEPTPPTGKTPEKEVKVYTTAIKLTKTNEDGKKTLTGAKFKIEGDSVEAVLVNQQVFVVDANGTYYRLKNGTYTTTDPSGENVDTTVYESTVTKYSLVDQVVEGTADETTLVKEGWVDENGIISFTGLGAGEYTITELVAPAGYNLLKEPVKVVITWNGEDAESMWTVKKGTTADNATADGISIDNNGYINFSVVNKAGVTLPATGGIGTTIFYVLGSILAVGSVILLVVRKRMSAEA